MLINVPVGQKLVFSCIKQRTGEERVGRGREGMSLPGARCSAYLRRFHPNPWGTCAVYARYRAGCRGNGWQAEVGLRGGFIFRVGAPSCARGKLHGPSLPARSPSSTAADAATATTTARCLALQAAATTTTTAPCLALQAQPGVHPALQTTPQRPHGTAPNWDTQWHVPLR